MNLTAFAAAAGGGVAAAAAGVAAAAVGIDVVAAELRRPVELGGVEVGVG